MGIAVAGFYKPDTLPSPNQQRKIGRNINIT